MIKGREIELLLKNVGTERGIVRVLTELVERQDSLEKNMTDFAKVVEQLVDAMGILRNATEGVTEVIAKMQQTKDDFNGETN